MLKHTKAAENFAVKIHFNVMRFISSVFIQDGHVDFNRLDWNPSLSPSLLIHMNHHNTYSFEIST